MKCGSVKFLHIIDNNIIISDTKQICFQFLRLDFNLFSLYQAIRELNSLDLMVGFICTVKFHVMTLNEKLLLLL